MLTPWGSAPWPSPFQAFIIIIINSLANGGGMSGAVTPGTGQLDPPLPIPPAPSYSCHAFGGTELLSESFPLPSLDKQLI